MIYSKVEYPIYQDLIKKLNWDLYYQGHDVYALIFCNKFQLYIASEIYKYNLLTHFILIRWHL